MRLAKTFAEIDSADREPAETRIRRFMPVGEIGGASKIAVSAFEVLIPSQDHAFQGVRFEVTSSNEYAGSGVATVALENAEKLMASLEQLANVRISTERFALTEVEASVEDLRVVVFNTAQGRTMAAVQADSATCHLSRHNELLNLQKLVSLAVEHLRREAIA